jgi:photosystem II stability/assembly factor-like uncharacterized protein
MALLCAALAATGCKKGTGTGTGGGGGGGGWLVDSSGRMFNVMDDLSVHNYATSFDVSLNGIACRGPGEAWVVGNAGTLLYTNDGGAKWDLQAVPATGDLRSLATQDDGPVFVAGNGTFLESDDTGATWRELGDGAAAFRSVAASRESGTVLAVSDDGALWSFDGAQLNKLTTLPGARAVAVSADGRVAVVAGAGLWRSDNAGETWTQLAAAPNSVFDDVRLDTSDNAIAVGAGGAIAMIDASGHVITQHVGTADLHALRIAGSGWGDAKSYAAGDGGQLLVSADAGWTWTMGPSVGSKVLGIDEIGLGHR